MRRLGTVLTLCSLFLVCSPATAGAMSWWVLEKLSGPPFKSKLWPPSIEARILCFNQGVETDKDTRQTTAMHTHGSGFLLSFCKDNVNDEVRALADEERKFRRQSLRRYASIDVGVSFAKSDRDPLFAANEEIDMAVISTSVSFHIAGPLELGAALNFNRFSSPGIPETFWKVVVEPVRVDFRPFHLRDKDWLTSPDNKKYWLREALVLRTGWMMFPGFSAAQLNSPIALGREAAMYTGVFLDFDTIIRKLQGSW